MPSLATQKKLNRAISSAKKIMGEPGELYEVIKIYDPTCPFHLERFRKSSEKGDEILKIRIVLDKIREEDKKICQDYKMPSKIFTKLIMCKRTDGKGFDYLEV